MMTASLHVIDNYVHFRHQLQGQIQGVRWMWMNPLRGSFFEAIGVERGLNLVFFGHLGRKRSLLEGVMSTKRSSGFVEEESVV